MDNKNKKESNLAYGGQALIEGILMRGKYGYAFSVKKQDGTLHKEKCDYVTIGKRIKVLGLPFIRGISGFFENMAIGLKVLNKSAEIAYPEENGEKVSNFTMFVTFALALVISMLIFVGIPNFFTSYFGKTLVAKNALLFNVISGILRMVLFFLYLVLISFMKDTKRLFGYHGAEHKTIHSYEKDELLNVENVKKSSRLHPRCGTSFIFIVFLITLVIFPMIDSLYVYEKWFLDLPRLIQVLIRTVLHIGIGMPLVSSVSYELLKLSGKFYKNFLVKILVAPGLFFQLFTTREPEDSMIRTGIISLNMVLGNEDVETVRNVDEEIVFTKPNSAFSAVISIIPMFLLNCIINDSE